MGRDPPTKGSSSAPAPSAGEPAPTQSRAGKQKTSVHCKISVPRSEWDELEARCARLERCLEQAVPDETQRRELLGRISASSSPLKPEVALPSHRRDFTSPSEEYISEGSSSPRGEGVPQPMKTPRLGTWAPPPKPHFLGHFKEFIANVLTLGWSGDCPSDTITLLDSIGRFQTHDPRPPRSLHEALYTKRTCRIFLWWPILLEQPRPLGAGARLARYAARWYTEVSPAGFYTRCPCSGMFTGCPMSTKNNAYRSDALFERAKSLMGNPLDTVRWSLSDLPLLVMMAVYLVEVNRTDAAYLYVSVGMHVGIIKGTHQGCVRDEHEKRSFWILYILDRSLCALMGRPPILLDESIYLALPADARGLPKPERLVAHVKLAKIAGHIVRKSCTQASSGDAGTSSTDSSYVDGTLRMLQKWSVTLPVELRLVNNIHMGSDRAACELRMEYNHLVILSLRPTLLDVAKKAVMARINHRTWHRQNSPQYSHAWQCLDAARENLRLAKCVHNSFASSSRNMLLAPFLHNVFDAAVIVLLHKILDEPADIDDDDDDDTNNIMFTIDCFDTEEGAINSSLPSDCARVLRDIKTLVQRMLNRGLGGVIAAATAAPQAGFVSKKNMSVSQAPPPAIYDVGFILNPEIPPEDPAAAPAHPSATTSSHTLFTELSSWIGNDEHQVYDGYSAF
ncbi:fungal specific transcription factor domain-containing protein [Apiospora phragmitis]|uniref:Fungal specific transcription factor domain-containing protein n=1 Tax=Apiospora phragmitis TaxID=2905665 RepID=A0ABR1VBW2_9PEZI